MNSALPLLLSIATTALAYCDPGSGGHDPTSLNTYPSITSCIHEPAFFSCENTTRIANTCCSPTPGGLVLATQFWSTYTGLEHKDQKLPQGSWTIHGLWPDNCDGYVQICRFTLSVSHKGSLDRLSSTVTLQDSMTLLPLQQAFQMEPQFPRTRALVWTPSSRSLEGNSS